jgi:uncharacterized protein YbaA (DUF1428 family)
VVGSHALDHDPQHVGGEARLRHVAVREDLAEIRVDAKSQEPVDSGCGRSTRDRASLESRSNFPHRTRRSIMTYVDGFVAAVPTANRNRYKEHAEAAARVFKEHGALSVVECWGDDVPDGKLTSFPMAVKLEPGETVVFSWITWPSRQARDAGMKNAMADRRLSPEVNPMPFDGKRLIYGGFEMLVEA